LQTKIDKRVKRRDAGNGGDDNPRAVLPVKPPFTAQGFVGKRQQHQTGNQPTIKRQSERGNIAAHRAADNKVTCPEERWQRKQTERHPQRAFRAGSKAVH